MEKSDTSIHKICTKQIEKCLMDSAILKYSSIHSLENQNFKIDLNRTLNELLICSIYIDSNNWSVLTTRYLYSCINSVKTKTSMSNASLLTYGMLKVKGVITKGKIKDVNENEIEFFIEVGEASMVMVQGVRQIIVIQPMSEEQIIKQVNRWKKQIKN